MTVAVQIGKERRPRLQPLQPRRRRLYWRGTPWMQQGIQRTASGSLSWPMGRLRRPSIILARRSRQKLAVEVMLHQIRHP